MIALSSRVETGSAAKYLVQLCKHFAHKVDVEYDDTTGCVRFPFGTCRLSADPQGLTIKCESADQEAADRLKTVLDVHLKRFGWREDLVVDWSQAV